MNSLKYGYPSFFPVAEEHQIFLIWNVIANCLIASDELHIAYLSFSRIEKHNILSPVILVAILFAGLTRE
jgi:hypothetical protein